MKHNLILHYADGGEFARIPVATASLTDAIFSIVGGVDKATNVEPVSVPRIEALHEHLRTGDAHAVFSLSDAFPLDEPVGHPLVWGATFEDAHREAEAFGTVIDPDDLAREIGAAR